MKPSEHTDAELATMVAERMGAIWLYPVQAWQFPTGEPRVVINWDPCNRADHWWMVVEWVRGQDRLVELWFALLGPDGPPIQFGNTVETKRDSLYWLFDQERPGRAICEAFVEVFCA